MTLLPSFEAASLIFTSEIISISPTAFALLPLLSVTACDAVPASALPDSPVDRPLQSVAWLCKQGDGHGHPETLRRGQAARNPRAAGADPGQNIFAKLLTH